MIVIKSGISLYFVTNEEAVSCQHKVYYLIYILFNLIQRLGQYSQVRLYDTSQIIEELVLSSFGNNLSDCCAEIKLNFECYDNLYRQHR